MVSAEFKAPNLGNIQIVHIAGKRQGEIDHFLPGVISFGRSPNCDVVFPRDALTVSRVHAKIHCYDFSCHLTNMSGNGCYVNGELRESALLSPGDVITFSEDGPKVSFLYEPPKRLEPTPGLKGITPISAQAGRVSSLYGNSVNQIEDENAGEFTIYFGRKLKSFYQQQINIGRSDNCDFSIDHPRVLDHHLVLFFDRGEYYLRNVTDLKLTRLNGSVVHTDTLLKPNDRIELNMFGPSLVYKGDGKFQETLQVAGAEDSISSTIKKREKQQQRPGKPGIFRQLVSKLFN